MEYSYITDIGLVRNKNQDAYLVIKNKYGDLFAIVADGIGGGKAGEVASYETVKYFENTFKESGPFEKIDDALDYFKYHTVKVNSEVNYISTTNPNYSGMGTTLSGVFISKVGCICINCGDSRVYGFIDNKIIQLTTDHTLVNQMLEKGQITYEQSLNHPQKHYLVRAIGIFDSVSFDINKVKDMDYYLVCSDGLHGYLDDEKIKEIVLNDELSIENKTITLKDAALLQGGYDNVTIILIKR